MNKEKEEDEFKFSEKDQKDFEYLVGSSYIRTGGHFRCVICNSVSSETIQTNIGDYHPNMPFVPDTKYKENHTCITCREVIDDMLHDYQLQDELMEEENASI